MKPANGVRPTAMASVYQFLPRAAATYLPISRNQTDTGMARLTLNDDDARVRRWFADEVQKLGCTLSVDQMGNMFARQAGRLKSSAPMIAMGSHLDTQPRGGRYDGILGIMAALEILRTMKENGFQTNFDVGVVNWTKYVTDHSGQALTSSLTIIAARKVLVFRNPCAPLASGLVPSPSRKHGICEISMIRT